MSTTKYSTRKLDEYLRDEYFIRLYILLNNGVAYCFQLEGNVLTFITEGLRLWKDTIVMIIIVLQVSIMEGFSVLFLSFVLKVVVMFI